MTNIAFFEPSYAAHNLRDWEIRGSYKYPSLLGNLHERAVVMLLMRDLPPEGDVHRRRLETEHGARFVRIEALEDAGAHAADMLAGDYGAAIAEHEPDIVSSLNGRMIGYNFALARAARSADVDFVYRIAGNDIATQTAVLEAQGRPVAGTAFLGNLIGQERYAAEAARTVIVMGGTERARAETLVSDPAKIRICRRGVDRTHFAPPARAPDRCDHILFVGRDSAEKGIDLIEAAAAILAEERPGLTFTIAGDFAAREEGNRRYLGFHDYAALPGLYRDHDALLLPARSEGFPQVVMEAMTCGLPAILSRDLFAGDFGSDDGVALVDLDPRGIADAIIRWHDDPALFAATRAQALGHAAAHFDAGANGALYHRALLGEDA
ncbi:MAG: glycosyltransferase family 4 protein [Parasphingopyxis sp.]